MGSLGKVVLENIDLFPIWADWSGIYFPNGEPFRPYGYEDKTYCPVGINNNDFIFICGKELFQLNYLSGKFTHFPYKNIMPGLEKYADINGKTLPKGDTSVISSVINCMLLAATQSDDERMQTFISLTSIMQSGPAGCSFMMEYPPAASYILDFMHNRCITLEQFLTLI